MIRKQLSYIITVFIFPLFFTHCDKDNQLSKNEKIIVNNEWTMTEVRSGVFDSNAPESEYVLSFDKSAFRLNLDINLCGGSYKFRGDDGINFSGGFCTEACCDSEFATLGLQELLEGNIYELGNEKTTFSVYNGADFVKFELATID